MDIELPESFEPVYELREVIKPKPKHETIWRPSRFYTRPGHFIKIVREFGIYNFTKDELYQMINLFKAFNRFFAEKYGRKRINFPSYYFLLRQITKYLDIDLEMDSSKFRSFNNRKFVDLWKEFILDVFINSLDD